jgi:hypothetical protein
LTPALWKEELINFPASRKTSLEGRDSSHPSIPKEHQKEGGEMKATLETRNNVSEVASRIGASLDEVGSRNLKNLGSQETQECSDKNLPAEMDGMETGLHARAQESTRKSPMTINAYGPSQDQVMMNVLQRDGDPSPASQDIPSKRNPTKTMFKMNCNQLLHRKLESLP